MLEIHVLKGNVGKDPELRYTQTGQGVCSFSLAVNHGKKNSDGEWENKTVWYKCSAWGQLAETVSEKLSKGDRITVVGNKLEVEQWTGKDDTVNFTLALTVNSVDFETHNEDSDEDEEEETPKKSKQQQKPSKPEQKKSGKKKQEEPEDIPF